MRAVERADIAEDFYRTTALEDMLDLPCEQVNDDRLYRALDRLLPHKRAIEEHLQKRLGELFALEYDLLLYDVTSTFFEGLADANPQAKRGHSRDHRPDCKQVCIALVVTREGVPLSYEVFDGNRVDVTTVEEIVGANGSALWSGGSDLGDGPRNDEPEEHRVAPEDGAEIRAGGLPAGGQALAPADRGGERLADGA